MRNLAGCGSEKRLEEQKPESDVVQGNLLILMRKKFGGNITMKNKRLLLTLSCCLLVLGGTIRTAEADGSRYEALQTARIYGPKIVRKYGAGVNINTRILSSAYSKTKKEWLMKLEVSWKGPLTGDFYQCNGWLTVKPATGSWSWNLKYANNNLLGWLILKGLIKEGVKQATTVSGSRIPGPTYHSKYPNGYYPIGREKFRICYGKTTLTRESGSSYPSWSKVKAFGDKLKGKLHVVDNSFRYSLLNYNEVLVLKAHNDRTNDHGYLAIYRSPTGSIYYRSNSSKKWSYLNKGKSGIPGNMYWTWDDAKVYIDVQRPDRNAISSTRQVDYRFRLVKK
ncbi:MAG: hypothetical protein Tsb009_35640 [Planctomycetaceae bacterium]